MICKCGNNQPVSMSIDGVPCCRVCGTVYEIMVMEGLKVVPTEAITDPYSFIQKYVPKRAGKRLHPKAKRKR